MNSAFERIAFYVECAKKVGVDRVVLSVDDVQVLLDYADPGDKPDQGPTAHPPQPNEQESTDVDKHSK